MVDDAVVIVSNRGPVSFFTGADGSLTSRRGAGGLVSGLGPVVAGTDVIWLAAALSDGDRRAAESGVIDADGFRVGIVDLPAEDQRLAYDVVCNSTLWYLHHGLFDHAREPVFDRSWGKAWDAYRRVNDAFATAIAEVAPSGATVLVQDYHLALVGPALTERRDDLRVVHFSHTPFAGPDGFGVLPEPIARELLGGLAGFAACGFHTSRWAEAFEASCRSVLGLVPPTFVAPLGPDPTDLLAVRDSPPGQAAAAALDDHLGDRRLIARVDRIELSKNLLRGFAAYDAFLDEHPEWHDRVVFGAFVYPSREGVAAYRAYRDDVRAAVDRLNRKWGRADWQPVLYDDSDDFPRSVAALARADVVLVNPIRDGLNLVAKEAPLVNRRNAVLLLSTEAGAWEELRDVAVGLNPYDVAGTAAALHDALELDGPIRSRRFTALRAAAGARSPMDWFADQLTAARS